MLEDKERALTGIAHLCILFQLVGLTIAFVIFFLEKDNSAFIQKGVKQAIGLQILVSIFVLMFRVGLLFGFVRTSGAIGVFTIVVVGLPYLVVIGFAFYAAAKSFKGNYFEYPVIGRLMTRLEF